MHRGFAFAAGARQKGDVQEEGRGWWKASTATVAGEGEDGMPLPQEPTRQLMEDDEERSETHIPGGDGTQDEVVDGGVPPPSQAAEPLLERRRYDADHHRLMATDEREYRSGRRRKRGRSAQKVESRRSRVRRALEGLDVIYDVYGKHDRQATGVELPFDVPLSNTIGASRLLTNRQILGLAKEDEERTLLRRLAHVGSGSAFEQGAGGIMVPRTLASLRAAQEDREKMDAGVRFFSDSQQREMARGDAQGVVRWSIHPKRRARLRTITAQGVPEKVEERRSASGAEQDRLAAHLRGRLGSEVRVALPPPPAPAQVPSGVEEDVGDVGWRMGFIPVDPRGITVEDDVATARMCLPGEEEGGGEDEVEEGRRGDSLLSWGVPRGERADVFVRQRRTALQRALRSSDAIRRDARYWLALALVETQSTAGESWLGLGETSVGADVAGVLGNTKDKPVHAWAVEAGRLRAISVLREGLREEARPRGALWRGIFRLLPCHPVPGDNVLRGWEVAESGGRRKEGGIADVVRSAIREEDPQVWAEMLGWVHVKECHLRSDVVRILLDALSGLDPPESVAELQAWETVWMMMFQRVGEAARLRGDAEVEQALWIALLEWMAAHPDPMSPASLPPATRVDLLEGFWDSEAPRIGEVPAGFGGFPEWVRAHAASALPRAAPASAANEVASAVERAAAIAARVRSEQTESERLDAQVTADAKAARAWAIGASGDARAPSDRMSASGWESSDPLPAQDDESGRTAARRMASADGGAWDEWVQLETFDRERSYRPLRAAEGDDARHGINVVPQRQVQFSVISRVFEARAEWEAKMARSGLHLGREIEMEWRRRAIATLWGVGVQIPSVDVLDSEEGLNSVIRASCTWRDWLGGPVEGDEGGLDRSIAPAALLPLHDGGMSGLLPPPAFLSPARAEWTRRALYRMRRSCPSDVAIMRMLIEFEAHLAAQHLRHADSAITRHRRQEAAVATLQLLMEVWQVTAPAAERNNLWLWMSLVQSYFIVHRQAESRKMADRIRAAAGAEALTMCPQFLLLCARLWLRGSRAQLSDVEGVGAAMWCFWSALGVNNGEIVSPEKAFKKRRKALQKERRGVEVSAEEVWRSLLPPTVLRAAKHHLRSAAERYEVGSESWVSWMLICAHWTFLLGLPMSAVWRDGHFRVQGGGDLVAATKASLEALKELMAVIRSQAGGEREEGSPPMLQKGTVFRPVAFTSAPLAPWEGRASDDGARAALWSGVVSIALHCEQLGLLPPSPLRSTMEHAIQANPSHAGLLYEISLPRRSAFPFSIRTAGLFSTILSSLHAPSIAAVFCALSALQSSSSTPGSQLMAQATLERLLQFPVGNRVPLLWRWLVRVLAQRRRQRSGKSAMRRALEANPSARALVLDGVVTLGGEGPEMREWAAACELGGVEWRVPLP